MELLKWTSGFFVYALTFTIITAAGGLWYLSSALKAEGPLVESAYYTIERGSGLRKIAAQLQDQGIINDEFIFMAGVMIKRRQSSLQAGEYQFDPHISANQVIYKLANGAVLRRVITIPEGLTSYQIIERLNNIEDLTGEVTTVPPEGSLLPETYDYQRGQNRQDIVNRMKSAMDKALQQLWDARQPELPFGTMEEARILASIVEKETGKAEERRRVAGVFVNRLRQNMALQTDPTVIYALTKGRPKNDGKGPLGRRLLKKDLQYDSPYNTYLYPGLPPGPIANPGYESLAATLNPEDHRYIFFVADGTGGHAFAETLNEHNKNVAKWRKVRAGQ